MATARWQIRKLPPDEAWWPSVRYEAKVWLSSWKTPERAHTMTLWGARHWAKRKASELVNPQEGVVETGEVSSDD